jgi:diguanylate cyclase (GGDEF)-like protein
VKRTTEIDIETGAYARPAFEFRFAQAVTRAHRARADLSLIHMDVDEVHERNELHGRAAVDIALGRLAQCASMVIDGRGPLGRTSGDEFSVFLCGVTLPVAMTLADQLRAAIAQQEHSSSNGAFRLTVSVGVAALRRGEPWGNLVDAAEEACLRAKQAGRNATVRR